MSILKIDLTIVPLFFFLFVSNTFWTKITERSHSAQSRVSIFYNVFSKGFLGKTEIVKKAFRNDAVLSVSTKMRK